MANQDTKLSKEQQGKLIRWLSEKGVEHNCPVCQENNWTVGDQLIRAAVHTPGVNVLGGPSLPMAYMLCNNCMYIRQFAAIPIGLLEVEKPEDKSDG